MFWLKREENADVKASLKVLDGVNNVQKLFFSFHTQTDAVNKNIGMKVGRKRCWTGVGETLSLNKTTTLEKIT